MAGLVGGVTVVIAGVDDTSKVMDQIEERMLRAAVPAADLGKKLGDGMGHAVPQVAAASAAIRLFEGQIPIRAVERLITMVPGLGAALQVAFPVVGGLVFGEMIVENIKKLHDLYVEAQRTGEKTKQEFGEAADKIREQANSIQIENDKLEEQISKLEKKPGNGLKLAIDEALESAQKLGTELRNDLKTIEGLTKSNETGFFARLTGQGSTDSDTKLVTDAQKAITDQADSGARVIDDMRERGATLAEIKTQEEKNLADLQSVYDRFVPKIRERRRQLVNLQDDKAYKAFGGDDNTNRINILGGALDIFDAQQRRAGAEFYQQNLKGTLAKDEASKSNDDRAAKAEELRRKMQEAQAALTASMVKLQQAGAEESLRQAKGQADQELAVLDASHKLKLVSDEDYYRSKLEIESRYNGAQLGAANLRRAAVNTQIGGLEGQTFSGPDAAAKREERDAKVNDLMAERLKIAGQIATVEADSAKKRIDAEAQILESHRRDAEENYSRVSTVLDAGRNNVAFRQRSGLISAGDARTQGHAIDAQQADELQKVVDAYQKLADISDDDTAAGANAKIAQLKEQILELRNPIDESTEALRVGFDNAFEGLFENIDQGTKSIENFAKSIQRTLMQQVYKELIQPQIDGVLRQAAGSVSGAIRPQAQLPSGVDLSSVVRPVAPAGVGGILGDITGSKGTTSNITIVLQQDATGAAKVTDVFADGNNRDHIIATVAGDISSGGILRQLLGHGL